MIRISAGRFFSCVVAFVACSFTVAGTKPAGAVIITGVDGTINTMAPPDDPGFVNVGARGSATGVYLGNSWVLTANHVGVGSIVLDGTSYSVLPGTTHRLKTPDLSADTDLVLYKINGDPGLPSLTISTSTPAVGSNVTMIGNGWNRAANQSYWSVDTTDPNNYVWTELGGPAGSNFSGYKWDTMGRTIRWGQNVIVNTSLSNQWDVGGAHGVVDGLFTMFNSSGVPNEAQAAVGDSGGAVFYKNGSNWELAGIMHLVFGYNNQPASTAVFGNLTFFSDLSLYRPQIMAVVPEPTAGILAAVAGVGLLAVRLRRRGTLL